MRKREEKAATYVTARSFKKNSTAFDSIHRFPFSHHRFCSVQAQRRKSGAYYILPPFPHLTSVKVQTRTPIPISRPSHLHTHTYSVKPSCSSVSGARIPLPAALGSGGDSPRLPRFPARCLLVFPAPMALSLIPLPGRCCALRVSLHLSLAVLRIGEALVL